VSLKVVLLHNGNRLPSVPFAHEASMKENYESLKLLVEKIKYDKFNWMLCDDLKVVALLLRMQLGYTKYCCFLCEWGSQDKKNHYVNKLWPKQTSLMPEEKSVVSPPLILLEKNYLPPLHIKLGYMKNFVKGMDKTGHGFKYVRNKFPNLSDAKIKEGMSFKRICKDFLGNHKAANYQDVAQDLLTLGCNMSLKIHFLESHFKFFCQKILVKTVMNMVKDFTNTLWLWKSGTKASGPQVCWQTIAGH